MKLGTGIDPAKHEMGSRRGLQALLASLAFLLTGAFAAWNLASWPVRLRYPGEQSYIEGMQLAEMLHLAQGVPIYAPASPERFDAAIYGPLYYLLGSQLMDPQEPAYFPLRVVSVLGTFGLAAGSGLLAFWLGRSYLAAALAPLLFLAYALVTTHGTSVRCDSIALLLVFAGFLIAFRLRKSRALLFAIPPMLLGFFYKPQFVAGPLAVVLFLLLERRRRLAWQFTGLFALGALGLSAFFQFGVFHGQAFLHHFLLYNVLSFSGTALKLGLMFLGLVLLVPLLMGLEFLRVNPNKLLSCYLGFAFLLSLLTVAREGSDTNYFLECVLILSSLVAALLAQRIADPSRVPELLLLVGATVFFGQWFTPSPPRQADFARDRAVQDFLRRNFSPQTRAFGYYTGDLLRAGLQTPISNAYHYTLLVRKGIVSDRGLLNQIQSRKFGAIVLNFDLRTEKYPHLRYHYLTQSWARAILEEYQLAGELELPGPEKLRDDDRFFAWVPRTEREDTSPGSALAPRQQRER